MKLNNVELQSITILKTDLKKEIKTKIEEKYSNRPISHIKLNTNNMNLNNNNNILTNENINANNLNNQFYNNIIQNLIPNLPTENNIGISSTVINHQATNPIENIFKGRIEDYKFIKEIGKGAYAIVKSAVHRPTGVKYAIKIYEKYKLMDPAKKAAVKREIQILKQIDHKNIVKMYEVIDAPKQVIKY
jgi:Protein kinase domain